MWEKKKMYFIYYQQPPGNPHFSDFSPFVHSSFDSAHSQCACTSKGLQRQVLLNGKSMNSEPKNCKHLKFWSGVYSFLTQKFEKRKQIPCRKQGIKPVMFSTGIPESNSYQDSNLKNKRKQYPMRSAFYKLEHCQTLPFFFFFFFF